MGGRESEQKPPGKTNLKDQRKAVQGFVRKFNKFYVENKALFVLIYIEYRFLVPVKAGQQIVHRYYTITYREMP